MILLGQSLDGTLRTGRTALLTICFGITAGTLSVPAPVHAQQIDVDPVLVGAIDLHAHLDPDGYGPGGNGRSLHVFELAELAEEAGMRGFVVKQHYDQSADSAFLARELYPDLEIFGGIGTNFATGGLNPDAIRQMGDVKGGLGRVVWMPTWDAHHYVLEHGNDRPYIQVVEDGKLLPSVTTAIAAVAEINGNTRFSNGKVVLATGHNEPEEVILMVAEARRLGLDVIVTHPMLYSVGMNLDQMRRAADLGGYLEIVSGFVRTEESINEHVAALREIGVEHFFVSSDRGQGRGAEGDESDAMTHLEGLVGAANVLRDHGFTEAELDTLFKDNPARVLGLPVR